MESKIHNINLQVKSVEDETGKFTAYGNVFNIKDTAGEMTVRGAFLNSIEYHKSKGTFPRLLSDHSHRSIENVIGVITDMYEDENGLVFEGKFLLDTRSGHDAYIKVKNNAVDTFSIGYVVIKDRHDITNNVKVLEEVHVKEISLVTFPANEESRVLSVKQAIESGEQITLRMAQKALQEAGFSKRQSETIVNTIKCDGAAKTETQKDDEMSQKQTQVVDSEAAKTAETKSADAEMSVKGLGNDWYCREALCVPVMSIVCVREFLSLLDPQGMQEVMDACEASRVRQAGRLISAGIIEAEDVKGIKGEDAETEVKTDANEDAGAETDSEKTEDAETDATDADEATEEKADENSDEEENEEESEAEKSSEDDMEIKQSLESILKTLNG